MADVSRFLVRGASRDAGDLRLLRLSPGALSLFLSGWPPPDFRRPFVLSAQLSAATFEASHVRSVLRYSLRLAEVGGFAPWFSFVLLVGVSVDSYRWLVSLWLGLGVGGFVISSAGVERP